MTMLTMFLIVLGAWVVLLLLLGIAVGTLLHQRNGDGS